VLKFWRVTFRRIPFSQDVMNSRAKPISSDRMARRGFQNRFELMSSPMGMVKYPGLHAFVKRSAMFERWEGAKLDDHHAILDLAPIRLFQSSKPPWRQFHAP
jgi:hypothetical protein